MKASEFRGLMDEIFNECKKLREAGLKEYAHDEEEVLANFKRVGADLDLEMTEVLMVYMLKHLDGIKAWVKGHRSQRENVRGRINDAIVYLMLLRAMVEELEGQEATDGLPNSACWTEPKDVSA